MKNKKFAESSDFFRKCCELAKVEPTSRQASKFRNNYGASFKQRDAVIRAGLIENKVIEEKKV